MEYPSTRSEAKATGAKHYFTGKPCIRGHVALRLTKGVCIECRKEDWEKDNEKRKGKPKTEAAKAAGRRYYLRNKELVKARAAARTVEDQRRYKKAHKERNPEYYKSLVNARRRRLKDATPRCQTAEQAKQIREVYAMALRMKEMTGVDYEVDHIIPIIRDNVCGLHVPWNLQILTKSENGSKNNSLSYIP
jgi:hypothetical protein